MIVGIEEHWMSRAFASTYPLEDQPGHDASLDALMEVGDGRIAEMDRAGIDVQVLGHGMYPATTAAVERVRAANDEIAAAIDKHPTRLAAFAALPLADIAEAADELDRTVTGHGFKGAMINGTVDGAFLDDPRFDALLAKATELDVPLYLHPAPPPTPVEQSYYRGPFDEFVGFTLGSTAAGWHWEVGLHVMRLIVSGIFDRHPGLQIIIGHMGELIPFYWERIESWLEPRATHLEHRVRDYFPRNVHVTTSGYTTNGPFELAMRVFGADRMIFSVDYPFSPNDPAVEFLANLPVPDDVREQVASGNAARLLKLDQQH